MLVNAWELPTFLHWARQYGLGFSPCKRRAGALLCLFWATEGCLCSARPWFPWWHVASLQWSGGRLQAVLFYSFPLAVDYPYVPLSVERVPTALARLSSLRLRMVHCVLSCLHGCVSWQEAHCQKISDQSMVLRSEHHWSSQMAAKMSFRSS